MEEKAAMLYQDCYPIKIKSIILVDAPWIVNTMVKLARIFLKKKLSDRIMNVNQKNLIKTDSFGNILLYYLFLS